MFIWLFTPYTYNGKYPDLYTTAVCNIFGVSGFSHNGDREYESVIEIIEKDDYGRTLYLYQEEQFSDEDGYHGGLVIMQYSDDKMVYYYEHCYLPIYTTSIEKIDYRTIFDAEQIENLKISNDWNNEIYI